MDSKNRISVAKNGPYVTHNCKLEDKNGKVIELEDGKALCRCGNSNHKPYCDGSHIKTEFDGHTEKEKSNKVKDYTGKDITVHFESYLCRHAGECVLNSPEVFNVNERPWIQPKDYDPNKLIATIKKCPSGALTYSIKGIKHKDYFKIQKVSIEEYGPLNIQGSVQLIKDDGTKYETIDHYSLCCCGKSKKKPFCDNSHNED